MVERHVLTNGCAVYARREGLEAVNFDFSDVIADEQQGRKIAAAYLAAPVFDRSALPMYRAFREETVRQFDFLTVSRASGGLGLEVAVCADDPYTAAADMMTEVIEHNRLRVFSTAACGNPHPFLTDDENDMFRAVHDVFGHTATGQGFDPDGEEAAWLKHSTMYTPAARLAMTTETRGQNSVMVWHFNGRRFPEQKAALLPVCFSDLRTISHKAAARGR